MTNEQILFLQNLAKAHGIIVQACALSKISRTAYYKWIKDKDFKSTCEEIILSQKEFVESKLLELIDAKDTTAIIFYLKTKGKDLGYTDKEVIPEKKKKIKIPSVNDADIEKKKQYIINLMDNYGKYNDIFLPQIEQVAQLMVRRDSLLSAMSESSYSPVSVQISREGNERISINPIETMYRDYCERVQAGLRALGLNVDSKPTKVESDAFTSFMDAMNTED